MYARRGYFTFLVMDFGNSSINHTELIGILEAGYRPNWPVRIRNTFDNQNGSIDIAVDGRVT